MTRANANEWFTGAKAANSIVPIARFVAPTIFATKTSGYLSISKASIATTQAREAPG